MHRALFIFRRDLRLDDNTGLIHALGAADEVIAAFIFTPEQVEHNPYRSDPCLQFMLESLDDLAQQLKKKGGKLYIFHGAVEEIVKKCIEKVGIEAVVVNRDYTPYSRARDQKMEKVCLQHGVTFLSFEDALLHPPEETVKKDGKPYAIFTPYFKALSKREVLPPLSNRRNNYFTKDIPFAEKGFEKKLRKKSSALWKGGRSEGLKILKELGSFKTYTKDRDFPYVEGTTHLSAYLKFTVVSPREVYAEIVKKLGPHHDLIRSLYWRDFFTTIAYFFPHVFKGAFHPRFDRLSWGGNKEDFKRWCEGKTGFPIVDAGMREMNETGYMHNRVRMIVSSFLIKDLHIDWRLGEKYFAQKLIDYDPAVNNGNWQWAASTGCDAQPYFRIFNPWSQQEKFDPQCLYIKKWVPELKSLSPSQIHHWAEDPTRASYPAPIVNHQVEAKKTLAAYKKVYQKK